MSDRSESKENEPFSTGLVVACSRRTAKVLLPYSDKAQQGRISPKIESIVVGDQVQTETRNEHLWITAVTSRKNCLSRSYANKTKEIAANLDRVYLITAAEGLINYDFIDRVLVTCHLQGIPVDLVFNKADLTCAITDLALYQDLGFNLIQTSALGEPGLTALTNLLQHRSDKNVALVGMSGVGKSSILNQLVVSAKRNTARVSYKTGKGQQTTSQAEGFLYQPPGQAAVLIIDLPGIQNFGISTLPQELIADCFPEFVALRGKCGFSDCKHLDEPECAVKIALEQGIVAISRYRSYISILDEIEKFKAF